MTCIFFNKRCNVENIKSFGRRNMCIWCGNKDKGGYKEIVFTEGIKNAKPMSVVVCDDQCATELKESEKRYEGKALLFLAGVLGGLVISVIGTIIAMTTKNFLWMLCNTIGLLLMGITTVNFPFVTPRTVEMFGYKKGFKIGRIGGAVLIALGLVTLVLVFFGKSGIGK
jgi:hypothetical protein